MGPIQSSLNQLTLSALGAVTGVAYGVKGAMKDVVKQPKAQKPQPAQPIKTETTNQGNIVKIGQNYGNTNMRSYSAAVKSIYSANDAIKSKALSQNIVSARLEQVKVASSLSITTPKKEEGGSK